MAALASTFKGNVACFQARQQNAAPRRGQLQVRGPQQPGGQPPLRRAPAPASAPVAPDRRPAFVGGNVAPGTPRRAAHCWLGSGGGHARAPRPRAPRRRGSPPRRLPSPPRR